MSALFTVNEWRTAAVADWAATAGALRARRQSLAQGGDPAWICLATAEQLESQLAQLAHLDPVACPLYGVPFAVKDNIDVAGWTTTAACPEFAYVAERTAPVVSALQRAGAVLLGKTNLDQFATGLVGTRSPYGAVPNTFSPEHVSGGSSSGSASVVARGLVAFALGTDTAGSGRIPAGFNNLIGLKPTPGTVSTAGVVPACRTLDCVSLLALTAGDAAAVYAVMASAAAPALDEPQFHRPPPPRLGFPLQLRVGVPEQPFFTSPAYGELFRRAADGLIGRGWFRGSFDLGPFRAVAELLYQGPWTAERYAIAGACIEGGGAGTDSTVARVIGAGRGYSAVDTFNAIYRVRELEAQTREVWSRFDVLMVPTAPGLPTLAEVAAEPVTRNSELGTYTNFVNLLGLSAVALPCGFTPEGLPFGVTFIAPGGSDWALAELASQWQRDLKLPLGADLRELSGLDSMIGTPPPASLPLAVVGAHLMGMPLHHQLVERGARLRQRTTTAAHYRLYALPGMPPPRPGLVRAAGGAKIAVEVYDMPMDTLGSFLAGIPAPLGLGRIELADGCWVNGFICEPCGLEGAEDITQWGGWRAYLRRGEPQPAAS
jgi:allophanate hydrolase